MKLLRSVETEDEDLILENSGDIRNHDEIYVASIQEEEKVNGAEELHPFILEVKIKYSCTLRVCHQAKNGSCDWCGE